MNQDILVKAMRRHECNYGTFRALDKVSLDVRPRRGELHHRSFGLGQEHASALHQSFGAVDGGAIWSRTN